jgi:predicted metal-dependent peptidase
MPFESGEGMADMALILDASYSTLKVWDYFIGHFNKMLDEVKPDNLHVIYTTTQVDKVETFTSDEYPVVLEIPRTGGTHMPAGVEYVEDNLPNVECMVVLTDGYTEFGEPSPIPVMWAITTPSITSPHGETVFVNPEE